MENMEDKLNSILSNPQMMSQLMSMAQALGQNSSVANQVSQAAQPKAQEASQQTPSPSAMNLDSDMLRKIISATQQTGIDKNQQGLLRALGPYLCQSRISKLEKAMRAAKIAGFAAAALNSSGKGR